MLRFDLTHTSHTTAQTGIQRVCRSFFSALGEGQPVEAVTYDPYQQTWRALSTREHRTLTTPAAAKKRGAHWSFMARMEGRLRGALNQRQTLLSDATSLIVPEVFSPKVAANLPELFAQITGPRVALFHDAIALKYPELTPSKTVARFPGYLRELLNFDAVAAVSEDSRASLTDYWQWLGIAKPPPVHTVTLPLMKTVLSTAQRANATDQSPLTLLCVGTIEGRKNHLALLDACEQLWAQNHTFALRIVGLAHPQTGRAALERLQALQAKKRALRYDGPVDDETLAKAYSECEFTVYPSLIEGFGLPVLESLSHGKPCICSGHGALGESARGGGCLALKTVDSLSLAEAIRQLLTDPTKRAELALAAEKRCFKSWSDYAGEFTSWMGGVSRRTP